MLAAVICVVVLLMVDWNKEAAIAQEKVKAVMLENEGLVAIDEVNDEEAPGTGTQSRTAACIEPAAMLPSTKLIRNLSMLYASVFPPLCSMPCLLT